MAKELEEKDLEVSLPRYYWEKFKSLDKFYRTTFLITGLFAIVLVSTGAAILNLRSHAGGGAVAAKVDINPALVSISVGQTQGISAIAYDYNNSPMFSGVSYEWSMSSTNSVATLSKTVSDITDLYGLKVGCGQLTVIARDGVNTITKSIQVVVSDSNSTPNCVTPSNYNRVFVTSNLYNASLGGLSGADAKCQVSADAGKLGGVWKAWLSDNITSVSARLIHSTSPYVNVNGSIIANNWQDLTDGNLQNRISKTEFGQDDGGQIWTNTKSDGSLKNTDNSKTCFNWTIGDNQYSGIVGDSNYTTASWTDRGYNGGLQGYGTCGEVGRLYCFEQPQSQITPTPTPISNPTAMVTSDVVLNAGNFYMDINGKRYYGTKPIELHSNVGNPYPTTTTLEAIWHENGVEMRLFIYFRVDPTNKNRWEIYDIRTYDGNANGEWLYYPADKSWGNFGNLGYPGIWQKLDLRSKTGNGLIHFDDLKLGPFKDYIPVGNVSLKVASTSNYSRNRLGVSLTWTKATNAVKYNLYHKTSKTQSYGGALISTAAQRYTAIVEANKPHYFVVEACSVSTCVKSNEVYVPLKGTVFTIPPGI